MLSTHANRKPLGGPISYCHLFTLSTECPRECRPIGDQARASGRAHDTVHILKVSPFASLRTEMDSQASPASHPFRSCEHSLWKRFSHALAVQSWKAIREFLIPAIPDMWHHGNHHSVL